MQLRRKLPFMGVDVLCSLKCGTFLKQTSESNRTERVRLRRGQTSGPKGSGKAQKWTAVLRYIKALCLIIRATLWRICSGLQRPSRQDGRRDPPRKLFLALVELRSLEQTSRRARLGLMPWSSFLFQLLCEVLSYSGFSFDRLLRLGE